MTTKLVSANMGIILVVEQDGEEKTVQFSVTCPSQNISQPLIALGELCGMFNKQFGTEYYVSTRAGSRITVSIAKPKKIKAERAVSQNEFNRKIEDLGYKP